MFAPGQDSVLDSAPRVRGRQGRRGAEGCGRPEAAVAQPVEDARAKKPAASPSAALAADKAPRPPASDDEAAQEPPPPNIGEGRRARTGARSSRIRGAQDSRHVHQGRARRRRLGASV